MCHVVNTDRRLYYYWSRRMSSSQHNETPLFTIVLRMQIFPGAYNRAIMHRTVMDANGSVDRTENLTPSSPLVYRSFPNGLSFYFFEYDILSLLRIVNCNKLNFLQLMCLIFFFSHNYENISLIINTLNALKTRKKI